MPTVIRFDGLPAGTAVTNQFQGDGIVFSGGETLVAPSAPSPPNVLKATDIDNRTPEFPVASLSGKFTDPHHSQVGVTVVLSPGAQFGGSATLTAYGINDNQIASIAIQVPVGQQSKYGEIFSTEKNIGRFKVSGGGNSSFVGVDDVTFDDLTVPQVPDFQLQYFGGVVNVVPPRPNTGGFGPEVDVLILVVLLNGSTGALQLSASNLPPGVTGQALALDPPLIKLTLLADDSASPVKNWNVVVTAAPLSTAAGQSIRTISIPVTVLDYYDARIVGIEVTQGIQDYDLAGYNLPGAFEVDYQNRGGRGTVVGMASGGKTIVRVFANIATMPRNSEVPPMDCQLSIFSDRVNQGVFTIYPENIFAPQPGPIPVPDKDRANPNNGYYFTLPPSWTWGELTLFAKISPTASFFPPEATNITNNDIFILKRIPFTPTRDLWIAPIACRITNDGGLYAPNDVLEEARNLLPLGDHQFNCNLDYSNTIDITDIYNQNDKACGFLGLASCPEDSTGRGISVAARLRDRADDWNYTELNYLVVGIYSAMASDRIRGLESRACTGPFWDCDGLSVAVFQDSGRPLSAVAHELGHLLGRQHASSACGADNSEDWPPDQQGFIQGVGLDRRTGRVIFPDRTGGSLGAPVYDFMGYCGQNGNYDPDKWISVRGWNATLQALAAGAPGSTDSVSAGSIRLLSMRVPSEQQLIVHAVHDHTGDFRITKVAPGHATSEERDPHSEYRLCVRGENGTVVSDMGMRVSGIHSEHGPDSQFLFAKAAVQNVRELESVEIFYRGKLVAKRMRCKQLPIIKDVSVSPDTKTQRGRRTLVKWNATHPENMSLMTKVDFSADAGKNWLPVYFGPNANQVALERSQLSASCEAIVRVRISDGFNETYADSCCFTSIGRPPRVRIRSPIECMKLRYGATLYLSGEAYDDNYQPIVGQQLIWRVGHKWVATGTTASVSGLKPGIYRVRLTATDAKKRSTTETIRLTVMAPSSTVGR